MYTTRLTPPAPTPRAGSLQMTGANRPITLTRITQGLTGKPGSGVPGAGGDLSYTHHQSAAAALWLVVHALGKQPAVTVVDSAGDAVEGAVRYLDANSLQISFSWPFSGRAFLN